MNKSISVIGGRAYSNGISFQTSNYVVYSFYKNGKITTKVKERKNKMVYFYDKIPFLRGAILPFELLLSDLKSVIYLIVGFSSLLFLNKFGDKINTTNKYFEYIFNPQVMVFAIIIFTLVWFKISKVGKYHAAEHMTHNAYSEGLDLTYENVSKQSRIHKNCGTNLVVFVLLIFFILYKLVLVFFIGSLIISWLIAFILSWAIAYEIFIVRDGLTYNIVKPLYVISGLLQYYLFTSKPTEKEIEVAIRSLKELEQIELGRG